MTDSTSLGFHRRHHRSYPPTFVQSCDEVRAYCSCKDITDSHDKLSIDPAAIRVSPARVERFRSAALRPYLAMSTIIWTLSVPDRENVIKAAFEGRRRLPYTLVPFNLNWIS